MTSSELSELDQLLRSPRTTKELQEILLKLVNGLMWDEIYREDHGDDE